MYHFFPSLLLIPSLWKSLLPSLLYLPTLLLRTSPLSFSSHLFPFSASSWRDIIIILVQSPLRLLLSSYDHGGITIPGQSPRIACLCPPPSLSSSLGDNLGRIIILSSKPPYDCFPYLPSLPLPIFSSTMSSLLSLSLILSSDSLITFILVTSKPASSRT